MRAQPSKVRKPRLNKRMPLGSGIAKHTSKPPASKGLLPESSGVNEPLIVSSEIRLSQPRRAGRILPTLMLLKAPAPAESVNSLEGEMTSNGGLRTPGLIFFGINRPESDTTSNAVTLRGGVPIGYH